MAFEDLASQFTGFSFDSFLSGDFSVLVPVFYLVIGIAVYSILIWHFYRFIAKRDCFKLSNCRYPKLVSFLKYFFLFPFVAFAFFIGFVLLMFFITRDLETEVVVTTAFAIILAIRITAYYSEDLSKDVAKMLPFALLGIFLVDPSYFDFQAIQVKLQNLPELLLQALQFIVLIIIVEWVLRILLTIRYAIIPKKETHDAE